MLRTDAALVDSTIDLNYYQDTAKLMTSKSQDKPFGIMVRLPDDDPLSAPHLLGDNWQSARWFASAAARDAAYESMIKQPGYYRRGDKPSIVLSKVDPA